jgi:hypothetical protein
VRDNIPLYLGALRPEAVAQTEVGYFKLALTIINLVMLPIEPFIWPTYAEITRTIAQKQWQATRRLLKRVSAIAGAWTLLAGGGMASGVVDHPVVYGSRCAPYPAMLIRSRPWIRQHIEWNHPYAGIGQAVFPGLAAAVGLVEILRSDRARYGYRSMAAILLAISSSRSWYRLAGCGKFRNRRATA